MTHSNSTKKFRHLRENAAYWYIVKSVRNNQPFDFMIHVRSSCMREFRISNLDMCVYVAEAVFRWAKPMMMKRLRSDGCRKRYYNNNNNNKWRFEENVVDGSLLMFHINAHRTHVLQKWEYKKNHCRIMAATRCTQYAKNVITGWRNARGTTNSAGACEEIVQDFCFVNSSYFSAAIHSGLFEALQLENKKRWFVCISVADDDDNSARNIQPIPKESHIASGIFHEFSFIRSFCDIISFVLTHCWDSVRFFLFSFFFLHCALTACLRNTSTSHAFCRAHIVVYECDASLKPTIVRRASAE